MLELRSQMPTDDEVFLVKFDKELIKAIDCLDTLLFLGKKIVSPKPAQENKQNE